MDQAAPRLYEANLSRQLLQREITLHQRSEAETLLMDFTRAQMTRHYWGEFAGSLQDLGLSARPQLVAKVDRDAVRTRLWIQPHHGTEAYLAEVERWGGRLRMRHCRGDRDGVRLVHEDRCPDGWQRIHLN
ncbi:thymidylate synthase [Synechococcus sp. MU1611]|nr:thymidylate synthase [Synechococcus sp. MU1650]MCB4412625.1 thymidylate synthase [Synechococcus sp. MU1611]